MKSNAIKFNGEASPIAQEAVSILEYVRDQVNSNRSELTPLEEAVREQMSGKPKKKAKKGGTKKGAGSAGGSGGASSGNVASVGGVSINLGDLSTSMHFDGAGGGGGGGADSDTDESFAGLMDL